MRYAVIMAGGAGTRLWPASRKGRPKQVLRLFGGESLLRKAYLRLATFIEPQRICVITLSSHLPFAAKEIPEIPPENLFGEPVGRDTANAIAMATAILQERDPDAVVGFFTADHIIHPVERFCETIQSGYDAAEQYPEALITFGVKATEPNTGYGYIQQGEDVGPDLYRVSRFVEKPDLSTAEGYLNEGNYSWNSGMFVWKSQAILSEIARLMPDTHKGVLKIAAQWGSPSHEEIITSIYPNLPKISIDFAVMQKSDQVLMKELDCQWADVGTWTSLRTILEADNAGNVSTSPRVSHEDSSNTIIVSGEEHLVATAGVDNLIIVHTPDATLVCHAEHAEDVKDLHEKIIEQFGERYS